ncbi:MAG: hypothetical protein KatS3mg036_0390 [Ignavibacterium sp.]|uniref:hypothetical protein n=1 Tax=Ignavibacterium sp. TaxID=2651167 RepID=UPI0021DDCFB8|nr:hypothetical protein [Ignavibacterium sp.]BDQ03566.1 MAG: hypothetical protein KatS3mg037_2141 [Ignavibacterium sp.]GIV45572.1 MAG: hypothetical protein KatS3mg036_0390 [Ignavibacterium sp.]
MKRLIIILTFTGLIFFNACDPFEDYFINLKMEQQFQLVGIGPNIEQQVDFCLSNYDDYNDNVDKIEQIKYLDAAYLTIDASANLSGENMILRLYQSDGNTLLFEYRLPSFVAEDYKNKPLHIQLSQSDKDRLNQYLANHKRNNCFKAILSVENVQSDNPLTLFFLNAKIEFVAELKLKP